MRKQQPLAQARRVCFSLRLHPIYFLLTPLPASPIGSSSVSACIVSPPQEFSKQHGKCCCGMTGGPRTLGESGVAPGHNRGGFGF